MTWLRLGAEVAAAQRDGAPVVALESTIFSALGLPPADSRAVFDGCVAAIRHAGAVPAPCAVVDGEARVGADDLDDWYDAVANTSHKLAARDLPLAHALGKRGVTTVSATLAIAAEAGIAVFATGGIGGVHRDVGRTGDISADLDAIARYPVVTVSAGVKGFLDVARTVEHLETASVPVMGFGTDEFPAFWCRTSGCPVPRVDEPEAVARAFGHLRRREGNGGLLLVVPCPEADAIDAATIDPVIEAALAAADREGIRGGAVTPFVLEHVRVATHGRSIAANRALAVQNAQIAARVACALAAAGPPRSL